MTALCNEILTLVLRSLQPIYLFSHSSNLGQSLISLAKSRQSLKSSLSSYTDPSSRQGAAIGCRIWIFDLDRTRQNYAAAMKKKKNAKKYASASLYEGRVVDYTSSTQNYTVQVDTGDDAGNADGNFITEFINSENDPFLLAQNIVWSRFQKHPFWPAMTIVPNEAAKRMELVSPSQIGENEEILHFNNTNNN